ncbi:DNA-damage-repair/toleration protein [Planoprotostelium fungivorum]|uniref:DNA-damage-repair/toleration protein n=1 Tax=Planoprotostelium fungivorum TaxID=1890364 RepID=A0A2P6N4R9_9EUKA|nr:DNA-damage-repair/toleration protein [Planoprotostelium fungivorum]
MSGTWSLYEDLPPPSTSTGSLSAPLSSLPTPDVPSSSATTSNAPESTPNEIVITSAAPTKAPIKETTTDWGSNTARLIAIRKAAAAKAAKPAPVKKISSLANSQLQKLKQAQNDLKQRESKFTEEEASLSHTIKVEEKVTPIPLTITHDPLENAQASQSIFGSAIEVYDPTKPNDYIKLIEERRRNLIKKDRETKMQAPVNPDFRPPSIYKNEDVPPPLHEEKEEKKPSPSKIQHEAPSISQPPAKKSKKSKKENNQTGPGVGVTNNSIVAKMMAKMGYKEGQGLGKTEDGITAPLIVKKTDGRTGVIVVGDAMKKISQKVQNNSVPLHLSSVVVLTNMVGPGEVDNELERETKEECTSKYGPVMQCIVHEDTRSGVANHEAVRIFVKFAHHDQAKRAIDDLNGRTFGGRKVVAQLYDEQSFVERAFQFG